MPPIWFKKKKPEVVVEIADLQNCGLEEVPKEIYKHGNTLHTLLLNSNNLTSLPPEVYNMWKIRQLEVWDNDLEQISPDIGNLCSLVHLNISRNLLIGLPLEMENCQELVYADFSSNPLSEFPEDLTRMYQLRQLFLNDTNLDRLPRQIGRMSKLEVLEVRENSLCELPDTCSHMTLLQHLNIGCNQFERLPLVVTMMVNLEELWMDMNVLTSLPRTLSNLVHLRVLDLTENRLLELPDTIGDLSQLTDLFLNDNSLTFLPESIGKLTNLKRLSIERNKLMILPQALGGLSGLQELNVSSNNLQMLPPSIGYLKNLTTFVAADNFLDFLPPEMGSCSGLQILSVQCNQLFSLPSEFCHLSQLTILNIVGNRIQNLPFSMTALKNIKALWISSTQSKPLIELQTEADLKLNRVLTCVYFPQKESEMFKKPSGPIEPHTNTTITFERKSSINFELTEDVSPRNNPKAKDAFSYPKEHHINAVKRMSRDLCSAMSDCSLSLSLTQTLSQNFSQQDYDCPSPSPANYKMATQVMKLQSKEKRQLMMVKRNSLIKEVDSENSSMSSESSFDELKKLQDVEEGSERAPSSIPSASTPVTQISVKPSPHPSVGTASERGGGSLGTASSSRSIKKVEVPKDTELELMLDTLEAEVKGLEGRLHSVGSSSPGPSFGSMSQQTVEIVGVPTSGSNEEDNQTVSEFISYDSSPKSYKKKTGSVPDVRGIGYSGHAHNSDGQSDLSVGERDKPFKLKLSAAKSLGSDLILNRLQDINDDNMSSSASTSRIDLWLKEQSKLQHEGMTAEKRSIDDSSVLGSDSASKMGTQETLILNTSTSDVSNPGVAASVANSSASESLHKPSSAARQWYSSPQTQHPKGVPPTHSPFSSISQSSTDNSISTTGGGGRPSSPTASSNYYKDSKRRPTSNLSRDSGYTSKEYVMMDPLANHASSSRLANAERSMKPAVVVVGGSAPKSAFRRSPTEPIISTEALNRRTEFFGSEHPPHSPSMVHHQRRASGGGAPYPPSGGAPYPPSGGAPYPPSGGGGGTRYLQSYSPGEKRSQKPRLPSTGHLPHTLNYDYTHTDRYYRTAPPPPGVGVSLDAARLGYYRHQMPPSPQRSVTAPTQPPKPQPPSVYAIPQPQGPPAALGFVAQLNKMSNKHSAKSAPLMNDNVPKQEAFQGSVIHGGMSMLGLDRELMASGDNWSRKPPLVQPKGVPGNYGKKYSASRHVRRNSTPFDDSAVIEAVIPKPNPTGALGITITGGVNSQNLCHPGNPALYILKLSENGPANLSGQLQSGDQILKVNGIEVKGFSQEQVASLLKQPLRQAVILVSRKVAVTLL